MDDIVKIIADGLSDGYADDAVVGDNIGLYDSDTNASLKIEKRVVLTSNGAPVSLVYTTSKRGRICQLRWLNLHAHYFIDDPEDQAAISNYAWRNGVTLDDILSNAPVKD